MWEMVLLSYLAVLSCITSAIEGICCLAERLVCMIVQLDWMMWGLFLRTIASVPHSVTPLTYTFVCLVQHPSTVQFQDGIACSGTQLHLVRIGRVRLIEKRCYGCVLAAFGWAG
jgi:hypothetical protein